MNIMDNKGTKKLKDIIKGDPIFFFASGINDIHPELERFAAEALINYNAIFFFHYKLYGKYPEFERLAAETMVKRSQLYNLFKLDLHKKYPELLLLISEE